MSGIHEWRARTLAPLRFPAFRRLWLASIATNFGAVIQLAAAAWAMTDLTTSPGLVALVQSFAMAPMVLLALPAGALADTVDRRKMMLAAQGIGLAATALLVISTFTGALSPALLLVFTAVIGAASALYLPAWQASFAELVPREDLPAVIGVNALSFNLARSIGPAVAGAVIAASGVIAAFLLNAMSYLALLVALVAWRPEKKTHALPREPFGEAMASGLRYIGLSSTLLSLLLRGALFGFGASVILALAPLLARQQHDAGPGAYGALLAGFGVGALIAALTLASVRQRAGNRRLVSAATCSGAVAAAGAGLSPSLAGAALCMMLAGASWIYALTTLVACLQLASPRWVVGRAVAAGYTAMTGGAALGAAAWGLVSEHAGSLVAFLGAGGFLLATLLAERIAPIPDDTMHDLSPAPRTIAAPGLPLESGSGPIVVLIEYKVAPARASDFLDAMHRFGRIRRRNGAVKWSIARDIDDPELWIERIESSSWASFQRRVSRGAAEDQLVRQAVLDLCRQEPCVRRLIERPAGAPALN